MGVETLPHIPAPQKGGLHPQLVLQPGSRVASAPQDARRATITSHTQQWRGTRACPKTLLCIQESQASCASLRVSLSTAEPQLCGPQASLPLPCTACPASRVLPSPTGLPSTPGPSPLTSGGCVLSPLPSRSPHLDLSVPERCQNFDYLRAFARAVSSSGNLCLSHPDTACPVTMSVFLHTQLNRPLESTASLTASPEAADCVLLFIVHICPSPFLNMGRAGTVAAFLAPVSLAPSAAWVPVATHERLRGKGRGHRGACGHSGGEGTTGRVRASGSAYTLSLAT